jgi:trimeric autotransporter adhesin
MNRVWGKAFVLTGLILMLGGAPSWGAPPNNDTSDAAGNTAGGTGALVSNTTGGFNTADGFNALVHNTAGIENTASGAFALFSNTTGAFNTASGVDALFSNTTGAFNTASGVYALFSNTTGAFNTANGFEALFSNTTGGSNIAIGFNALVFNSIGSNNIAIGQGAGGLLTSGSNNIYLGNSSATATESNIMRLGGVQTQTFIAGIFGQNVGASSPVFINSNGQLGTVQSSARYKRDIHAIGAHNQGLFHLRPVSFRYTQDTTAQKHYGLIAEEVDKVYPELVVRGRDGAIETVQYHELIPLLLNEVQHQHQELGAQARQLAELKTQNARLRAAVAQQEEREAALAARLERLEAAAARAATLASR